MGAVDSTGATGSGACGGGPPYTGAGNGSRQPITMPAAVSTAPRVTRRLRSSRVSSRSSCTGSIEVRLAPQNGQLCSVVRTCL